MKKIISGIQQIGIGVENIDEAWSWYRKYFGMDICIFEEKATAEFMLHYTENESRERHAILTINMQGGGGFELWQHLKRKPQMPHKPLSLGDLGINICKIKTANIYAAINYFVENKLNVLSEILESPRKIKHFYVSDPYGNIFQFVEEQYIFMTTKRYNGGVFGAIIGVSDIEKSLVVYQDILNYDEIVYDISGQFEDFLPLQGGNNKFRRILLKHSENRKGAFAKLFGPSQIELIQVIDRKPQSIFSERMWGDPGFIHICFDIHGFTQLREECEKKGYPFTVDSTKTMDKVFDIGAAAGDFSYISDTDGTPIEFVETHKVPVIKKLGWYIKLYKRDPEKSLPSWLIKLLRFQKRK